MFGDHHDKQSDHKHETGHAIVARFESQAEARQAVKALHKAHYTHTWLGATSVGRTSTGDEALTVESSSGFFSQTTSLVDALVSHGVLGDTAREIERTIVPGDALLTVDPKDRDSLEAISLLEQSGGHIAGHTVEADTDLLLPPPQRRTARNSETLDDAVSSYGDEDLFYHRGPATQR